VAALQVLTHTEFTALDNDHANALDKTVAGDSIAGAITWLSGSSATWANGSSATVNGHVTIGTGTLTVSGGGTFDLVAGCAATINTGAGLQVAAGAAIEVNGAGAEVHTYAGGRIVLGDNDWIKLSAARALTGQMVHFGASPLPAGTTGWSQGLNGLTSTAAGATCQFPIQRSLKDGATLATVDVYVYPAPGAHGATLAGTVTMYKRTLVGGAGVPGWVSVGSVSMTGGGGTWGDGQIKKLTFSPAAVVTSSDEISFGISDENVSGGTYPVGGVYNIVMAAVLNYTITEHRPG
jgi:hypothetical protein